MSRLIFSSSCFLFFFFFFTLHQLNATHGVFSARSESRWVSNTHYEITTTPRWKRVLSGCVKDMVTRRAIFVINIVEVPELPEMINWVLLLEKTIVQLAVCSHRRALPGNIACISPSSRRICNFLCTTGIWNIPSITTVTGLGNLCPVYFTTAETLLSDYLSQKSLFDPQLTERTGQICTGQRRYDKSH